MLNKLIKPKDLLSIKNGSPQIYSVRFLYMLFFFFSRITIVIYYTIVLYNFNGICPFDIITGTPGTGKSTLSEELASRTGLQNVSITIIAEENQYYDGYDEERKCHILDDDRVS